MVYKKREKKKPTEQENYRPQKMHSKTDKNTRLVLLKLHKTNANSLALIKFRSSTPINTKYLNIFHNNMFCMTNKNTVFLKLVMR